MFQNEKLKISNTIHPMDNGSYFTEIWEAEA
jgi:hypothetical protein